MEISLYACRINAKMNRVDFAAKVGVSASTIYNWERGITEPNLTQLRKISELSGISLDCIVVGIDSVMMNTDS